MMKLKLSNGKNRLPWWLSGKESRLVKNTSNASLTPESGRSPGEGNGNPHSSIFAWEIPWAEESGGLQSMGLQKSQT